MDSRQLVGLVLVIAGALWLIIIGRGSSEEGTLGVSESQNARQRFVRWLKAVAKELPSRSLLGVVLLILGALLLVPWNNVLGSPESTAPCCPPGALPGSVTVMLVASRAPFAEGWRCPAS